MEAHYFLFLALIRTQAAFFLQPRLSSQARNATAVIQSFVALANVIQIAGIFCVLDMLSLSLERVLSP
jgi:hypothetical protein